MATEPEFEYKTWRNPNNYYFKEDCLEGHKFGYIKRRRYKSDSTFKQFQPKCSCRTKIWKDVWVTGATGTRAIEKALGLYNEHIKTMRNTTRQLPFWDKV